MRERIKKAGFVFLCTLFFLFPLSARAKVTTLKSTSLKNVTKAKSVQGEWVKKGKRFRFRKANGKYLKNRWFKANGKICYVDSKGYRVKGWVKYRGNIYYLDKKGALRTGWLKKGKKYYYLKKNGRRKGGAYDPSVKVKSEVDPKKPMVALTFDDGPGPHTNRLLDCLKKNNAKATFFMVGSSVPNYKSTVKKMAEMGCELGNHSYSHAAFSVLSDSAIASEVARTSSNIKSAAGHGPTVARLPYGDGASNGRVLSALGLPSIYWSIDTRDWANTGNPGHTVSAVLDHVKNGDIILMHDIHRSTVDAAEKIIPALRKRGYQLVTVSQLAKYKGKTTLHSGKTYYHF